MDLRIIVTRESEQVRAFRDTWKDGLHSYLTYLRDRLTVARDLLSESGSIFIQIGDENVHRVRALMDEVFGEENLITQITFRTTTGRAGRFLSAASNYILWYGKNRDVTKYRNLFSDKAEAGSTDQVYSLLRKTDGSSRRISKKERSDKSSFASDERLFRPDNLTSQSGSEKSAFGVEFSGKLIKPGKGFWKSNSTGLTRLKRADRIWITKSASLQYIRYFNDFPVIGLSNVWNDTGTGSFTDEKVYVVQTGAKTIERCILMATDPGDLVLDPTCGSGTTAYVAEQWGRRWVTIDTSRVAIALARSRIMGARYPFYLLSDSSEGQQKVAEITRSAPKTVPIYNDLRQGFVCERVPHITLKSIANNSEIDVIWEREQPIVENAINHLNTALSEHSIPFKIENGGRMGSIIDFTAKGEVVLPSGEAAPVNGFMEWEIPRVPPLGWPSIAKGALLHFWETRVARQKAIDASIAVKAENEYLYDKPFVDTARVRVAGPFTVESVSPHRTLEVDWNDELKSQKQPSNAKDFNIQIDNGAADFAQMIIENLKIAGVQQAHKEDKISFESLKLWPGRYISAEGIYTEDEVQRRAGVFIGPEFGTVSRQDLVEAAKEANGTEFDVLVACAFNYDAHSSEFNKLGRIPILKARMNPDLHMGGDLKATSAGNLFVVFGEPDIRIETLPDEMLQVQVYGIDVFKPQTGEVVSENTDGIALWMLDTDYNEESFFVRHAYFLGANDPYKALKTTLKAEIDAEAWSTLNSDISRPFPKPDSGRIAVKVINHLGDEVMKVFAV